MGIIAKNSPYILGIDLGTSTSSVAIFHKGAPEVIKISGQKCIPSVVHVRDNGEILVGQQAKSKMLVDPANTVASIKREMGNPEYLKEFKGLPDRKFRPLEIASEILNEVKRAVEETDQVELRGTPKYAVICVPANFDDKKKNETLEAGQLAGFEVLYLLEEPVAAAIAYGFDKDRDQTILVYDLGGGTFDVSILEVDTASEGSAGFKVRAKEGIPKLGGDDFDEKIMEIVNNRFMGDSGIDIFDLKKDQGIANKLLMEAQQKLKEATEAAKKELSLSESSRIEIPNFIKDEGGTVHHIDVEVTRADFEDSISELIWQSQLAVENSLKSANMTIDDISRIVLVGGSTRVPLVKSMLTAMFGKEPYSDMDPETLVATGASIFGASLGVPSNEIQDTGEILNEDQIDKQFSWQNIVTHHLGIEVYGRKFSKIIEKNTELTEDQPVVTGTKIYTAPRDNATELAINVYQAPNDVEFITDEGAVCIGELFMTGIPAGPVGSAKIVVTFEIDRQNLLKVNASCMGADGATRSLEIKRT